MSKIIDKCFNEDYNAHMELRQRNKKKAQHWLAIETEIRPSRFSRSDLGTLIITSSIGPKFAYRVTGDCHLIMYSPCCDCRLLYLPSQEFHCPKCNVKYPYAAENKIYIPATASEMIHLGNPSDEPVLILFLTKWISQFKDPLTAVIDADYLAMLIEKSGLLECQSMTFNEAKKWIQKTRLVTLDT